MKLDSMKNFTIILTLFISVSLFAQEAEVVGMDETQLENPWTFGGKAGLNLASVDGSYLDLDYVVGSSGFIGFHGGGWVNYALNEKMAIQAELLGSLQGGNLDYELVYQGNTIRSEVKMRLPYILLPVLEVN